MINGNQVCFGYGDIIVSQVDNNITFKEIKPIYEIGDILEGNPCEYTGKKVTLSLSISELHELDRLLADVRRGNPIVQINDIELNFENYNEVSLHTTHSVVRRMLNNKIKLAAL